jgi:2,3-bisphosphoglycerate-independent phosphoglycerate mutase
MARDTTVLIILDGWGMAPETQKGNAITPTTAPNFFDWWKNYPHAELNASGQAVGLFRGQEGNSEAGHLNIGAGRVVKQDALYISDAIRDGTFYKNNAFLQALHHQKKYRTQVHLMGLLSNHNSAHSNPEHLYALLDMLHEQGVKKVFLHLFTDGRDSGQHDAQLHLKKLEEHFHGTEQVATVMGRYYGMDRNKVWERTEAAYRAITDGDGRTAEDADTAITLAYNSGETDEFIAPTVMVKNGKPLTTVQDNDVVFFFNLRSDRARELTKAFVQPDFEKMNPGAFHRRVEPHHIRFVALADFGPDLPGVLTAFPSRDVPNSLVQTLCPRPQLYIAESEKFAHITYFLNGGYAQHFCDEQWVKIDSDHVKDFVVKPEMKAKEVGEYVCNALNQERYDFIAVNFANADMLGHTGNIAAAEAGVAFLDNIIAEVVLAAKKVGATCIITADHGNAEEMVNLKTGEIDSEHSIYPVPFICIAPPDKIKKFKIRKNLPPGQLADVAPTILKLMSIDKPAVMTGHSLI